MGIFNSPDVEIMKAKKNIKGLVKALEYQKNPSLKWEAAEVLAEIGKPALEPLIAFMTKRKGGVREAAIMALMKMGDPRASETIISEIGSWIFELKDENNNTPLHWVAEKGNVELVEILTEYGVRVDAENDFAETPLSYASENGHYEAVKLLLESGADVDTGGALSSAAQNGHYEVVKLLFEKGASPDLFQQQDARTPFGHAVFKGRFEIAKLLLEYGADIDAGLYKPLHEAVAEGKLKRVKFLLSSGAGVNCIRPHDDSTPLHVITERSAINKNKIEIAKLLLDAGANINQQNHYNNTLLHELFYGYLHSKPRSSDMEMIKLLLEYGANVKARNEDGETPLSLAQRAGCTEAAKLLKSYSGVKAGKD